VAASKRKPKEQILLDAREITKLIGRLCDDALKHNQPWENLALVGIRTGGAYLAERMQKRIKTRTGLKLPLGQLDITMYRDDIYHGNEMPQIRPTHIPFDINHKMVVLVDDVLFTGRTIRAAMEQLFDFGRPKTIRLAVLVDRGSRELPVQPDYVGLYHETGVGQVVKVFLKEEGEEDRVVVREKETP